VKNITLSADAELIELARKKAEKNKTSLNKVFREWLNNYVKSEQKEKLSYEEFWARFDGIDLSGPKMTREEMNER